MKNIILLPALILSLSSCASIIDGRSQQIAINSDPQGAECRLIRKGDIIGKVITPGSVYIEKTKDDMTIECKKPGYMPNSISNHSGAAGSTFGNILAGGLIGWGIDSATGADNHYDESVLVTLERK